MPRARHTSASRKDELVDAALDIIATRGITALSTRTLSEAVHLSSGALFRHFPTLDALLDAVVARVESVIDATLPPATLPPAERLCRFVEARTAAVGNHPGILRLVLSEQFKLALPGRGSARLAACVARTRRFLVTCIREGQASGEFRRPPGPEALAAIIMGTVQVLALTPEVQRGNIQAVKLALLLLLRGKRPARPKRMTPGRSA